jgi:hypothetical protein
MPRIIRGGLALGAVVFSLAAVALFGGHLFGSESHSEGSPAVAAADARPSVSVPAPEGTARWTQAAPAALGTDRAVGPALEQLPDGTAAPSPLVYQTGASPPDPATPDTARVAQPTAQNTREQAVRAALLLVIAVVSVVVLLKRGRR